MAKRLDPFKRKTHQRKPHKVILIIGEGQTEEAYFQAVRQKLRSPLLRLEIEPAKTKSDPVNLVKKAKLRHKTGDYDYVFCVFDGDKAAEAQQAQQHLGKCGDKVRGFISVPCFEVWLTLHFEYSDAALLDCQQSEARLKRHWSVYAKGCDCDCLMPRLDTACENAIWLERQKHAYPYTDLHHLIDVLKHALKESR